MSRKVDAAFWGVEWRSRNTMDGAQSCLQWDLEVRPLFPTRRKCRAYIDQKYGWISTRPDLRQEPHGWLMPQAVRVEVRRVRGKGGGR